jgi:hypothetical protein
MEGPRIVASGGGKTVQSRMLHKAQEFWWACMTRGDAEHWRGFDPTVPAGESFPKRSLFNKDLLAGKLRVPWPVEKERACRG